jgi:hypothetical protein
MNTQTLADFCAANNFPLSALAALPRIAAALTPDDVAVTIRHYHNGFVPNSYKYKAPGKFSELRVSGAGAVVTTGTYDRKRSNGNGSTLIVRAQKPGQSDGRVLAW